MRCSTEVMGFLDPTWIPVVSVGMGWSSCNAVPVLALSGDGGSSSRELRSPSEFSRLSPARVRSPHRAPPLGFFPSSRRQCVKSTISERPCSPSFRPQRFARSRRVTPSRTLRVCFIPLPRPGFPLQGLPPTSQPPHLLGDASPHVVGTRTLPTDVPAPAPGCVDLRVSSDP